ncbi:MAG: DMT family transporter [Lachnospiraceae bacterium]|nr:DMT family transporter [Lachnospiraceae bacterium]
MWMWLVLLYGLIKGAREIVKKKSLQYSSVAEVLFFYTLFAFLMVLPDCKNAMGISVHMLGWIFLKSLIIFCAWILSFKAIKKMPISLYGVLDLSRVLFATLLGSVVLNEVMSTNQILGLILVATGLLLLKVHIPLKKTDKDEKDKVKPIIVIFSLLSCMLNALSGLLDKILMRDLNSSQLQFFYMLFLVLLYGLYMWIGKEEVNLKKAVKNPWIWLLALLFVIADRALFLANADPESKITIMTLIKQSGCVVTLAAGKWIYHEKHVLHRALCTVLVVVGIVVAVL